MNSDCIQLLTRSAVVQLFEAGPDFREFVDRLAAPGSPVRRFPNGAIEIDLRRVDETEWRKGLTACATPGKELEGCGVFPSIGPFTPKRFYGIQYPIRYQQKLKSEDSFSAGRGRALPPDPGEFDLANLEVTVLFRTRVSKGIQKSFAEAVASWGREAAQHGAFNDGPVILLPPGIEFKGVRARFHLDARHSGQDTLNWLSLAIFDFGESVHTITSIHYGASSERLDRFTGPLPGKAVLVEFPLDIRPTPPDKQHAMSPSTRISPNVQPEPRFQARNFAVLSFPLNEWDSFRMTLYFQRSV
jgi:hypothetical protein